MQYSTAFASRNGYFLLHTSTALTDNVQASAGCCSFPLQDRLRVYKETRNGMVGADYSSKFSAWLAHGCISPRFIYEEVTP